MMDDKILTLYYRTLRLVGHYKNLSFLFFWYCHLSICVGHILIMDKKMKILEKLSL
jgi:hypothetical protein